MSPPSLTRAASIVCLASIAGPTLAAPATFDIDTDASVLRVTSSSVSVSIFSFPGAPTQAGSFDAPLAGTIELDLQPGTLEILPASLIAALDDTLYLPGDITDPLTPTPGSLAILYDTSVVAGFDVIAVTRAVTVSLDDVAPRAIDGLDGTFDASGVAGAFVTGVVDIAADTASQGALAGEPLVPNTPGALGSLIQDAGVETLTLPLAYSLIFEDAVNATILTVVLEGEVVARRTLQVCAADLDGNGSTDVFDFAELASNFGAGPGATLSMGDITGDGFIDVFDFAELAADFGCSGS